MMVSFPGGRFYAPQDTAMAINSQPLGRIVAAEAIYFNIPTT
ncbi:hypothetical protein [Bradyrhizobium sp.]